MVSEPSPRAWSVRGSRARPESTTTRTPGTVRLDSATDVASTTRRRRGAGRQHGVLDRGRCAAVHLEHLDAGAGSIPATRAISPDAGQEAQHVAVPFGERPPDHGGDVRQQGGVDAHAVRRARRGAAAAPTRPPPDASRRRARTRRARRRAGAAQAGVGGGRGGDQPQVGAQRVAYVQQEGQRRVGVQVAFVALVEHDRVRRPELLVALEALQEHAGGDDLHRAARPAFAATV